MKLPADKTWMIAITMVVTYAITVAILLIERRSGEVVTNAPADSAPMIRHEGPGVPAVPRRVGPQAPGMRPRQMDPAQRNPG